MARKKSEEEPCGNWMDTYGDMVTLLLTFFVMLFSMSSVNEEKYAILVKAFTSKYPDSTNLIIDQNGSTDATMEFPMNRGDDEPSYDNLSNATLEEVAGMVPQDFDDLYEYLKAYVEKSDAAGSVEIEKKADGSVFIRFQDNVFFAADSAVLRGSSYPLLDFLGNCLKSVEDQILTVNINGHTADPKIDNYRVSSWRLSADRAASVAIYFEDEKKIDASKLLPIGYGKSSPIADNSTEEGMSRNRRVDMLIVSNSSSLTDTDLLKSILQGTFDPEEYPEEGGVGDVLMPSENGSGSSSAHSGSSSQSGTSTSHASGSGSGTSSSSGSTQP